MAEFQRYFFSTFQVSVALLPADAAIQVSVALLPADAAMEHTEKLPAAIDPSKWRFRGTTARQLAEMSRSQEIHQRCLERTAYPQGACRELLTELRESGGFWLALRRHLTVRDTEYALRVLQENSGWKDVKRSPNEILRKEYFKLFDECKHFDPDWVDAEMKRRVEQNQIVPVKPPESSGSGKGDKGPSVESSGSGKGDKGPSVVV